MCERCERKGCWPNGQLGIKSIATVVATTLTIIATIIAVIIIILVIIGAHTCS